MAQKRKLVLPVPERDQGQQMWESLLAVAANAREANAASTPEDEIRTLRGQAMFDKLGRSLARRGRRHRPD